MADVSRFFNAVSATAPSGVDLAYSPLLASIRAALQIRMDRKIVNDSSGNRREEAVLIEPDWRKIRALCEEALAEGRHLEVCLDYATALLELNGLAGAAAGLELIDKLLHQFWDSVFPALDSTDDHDPSLRIGLIENLSATPAPLNEDPLNFVRRLSRAPLCKSRGGTVSLADFKDGRVPAPGTPEAAPVQGAFAAMLAEAGGPEALAANKAAVEMAVNSLDRIKIFLAGVPGGRTPDFDLILETLKRQRRILDVFASDPSEAEAVSSVEELHENVTGNTTASAPISGAIKSPSLSASPGQINGAADITQMLDLICAYYAKAEPSSPVPLLLRRARRLVGKSFLEVIGDLSAGSIDEIRKITGEAPAHD